MILHIDEQNRIRGTEHCWQIERLRKTKDGELWKPTKYYTTLGMALQEAAQREIRLAPATGIAEALDACNRVVEKYSRIFDDVGKTLGGAQ